MALLGAGLGAALAACSVLDGLNADYTLRTDSAEEAGAEAGADATSGADALDDGPALDARVDGPLGRFCDLHGDATDVVFCWDFEDDTVDAAPGLGWDGVELTNGSFDILADAGTNGSKALHSVIDTASSTGATVFVRKQSATPFSAITDHTLSFAYSIRKNSTLYTAVIGALGYGTSTSFKTWGLSVYQTPEEGQTVDISDPPGNVGGDPAGIFVNVVTNAWKRATIEMKRTGAGPGYHTKMTVTELDGTSPLVVDDRDGFVAADAGTTLVLLGAFFTSAVDAGGGVETVIDDVLITETK